MGGVYHIYISHAWRFGLEYDLLITILGTASDFPHINWSSPYDKPEPYHFDLIPEATAVQAVAEKIRYARCLVVLADVYVDWPEWVELEMDLAKAQSMPLIGINPRRARMAPGGVADRVAEMVDWDSDLIVSAIRSYYA